MDRPILFSGPMVRALLNDAKGQTRRTMKGKALDWLTLGSASYKANDGSWHFEDDSGATHPFSAICPYGKTGDRLWVRETHAIVPATAYAGSRDNDQPIPHTTQSRVGGHTIWAIYAADWTRAAPGRWRPSIHMPRWASRITLDITGVRVERLQAISEADCIAEGCAGGHDSIPGYGFSATPREHYCHLWKTINGPGSWGLNPWVWVVSFKRAVTP